MKLGTIIQPTTVIGGLKANSKKQLLQELSAIAARESVLNERDIFDTLLQRERLGSTGIGNGIAIPHGRIAHITHLTGVFAHLERPVDFESVDGVPVDMVFLLLAPEGAGADHLQGLARIARLLRNPLIQQKLRSTQDAAALYAILTVEDSSRAA